jgi:hypothetical protein
MGCAGNRQSDAIRGRKAHAGLSILELTRVRFNEDTAIDNDPVCALQPRSGHVRNSFAGRFILR